MKFSELFIKTNKSAKEYDSANATFLIKGGFIDQTMAGVYSLLPLGWRVLEKIEAIVREEIDTIGVEMLMPALSPVQLWEATDRYEAIDVLFSAQGGNDASRERNDASYVLNSTHEEVITPIALQYNRSYRDFPFAVYQIQNKFRNEARPKSGILRGREFRMKDLYSFHRSEAELNEYYEQSKEVYTRVFERLGLGEDTRIVLASGGDFTDEYSHEFQTRCETGEDLVFYDAEADVAYNREVAPSSAPAFSQNEDQQEMEKVKTAGITGMSALTEFLQVEPEQCVKTMLYQADDRVVAVAVRGDYDVNELKVKQVVEAKTLALASAEVVEEVTGAAVGFAGVVGLPETVELFADESLSSLVNFECGANETDHHLVNVNWERDVKRPEQFYDLKLAKEGDSNPETGEQYEVFAASEVGNIFRLGTKFSEAFDYYYTDEQGKQQQVWMGSYGIGTTRVMGVLVEKFHDENGIIWPEQVAPFGVHLVSLTGMEERASDVYAELVEAGIEVLWDDRDASPGEKFADADLIGCPVRLVVSERNGQQIEWKCRDREEAELLTLEEVLERLH